MPIWIIRDYLLNYNLEYAFKSKEEANAYIGTLNDESGRYGTVRYWLVDTIKEAKQ